MNKKWAMPPPDEALQAIDEWRKLNLVSAEKDEVLEHFNRIFSSMLRGFCAESQTGGRSTFFRIRQCDELIDHENGLWAPQPENANKGRCNFAQEPVLYVSTEAATCFDELNIEVGNDVYLISYKKRLGELRLRSAFGTDLASNGLAEGVFNSEPDTLSYQILREFLRSEFMKPTCCKCDGSNFIYNVTASIAAYLKSQPNVDGFIYPSAVNVASTNVALFPERERVKLEIADVRIVRLVSSHMGKIEYEPRFVGTISEQKKVSWTPCSGTRSCRKPTAEKDG